MMGSQGYTRITPVSAKVSLRTVVATSPIKYKRRAATWLSLDALCAHVAVLLAICHDHAEFVRIALDRVLPTIHRPSIQDGDFRQVTVTSWGHDKGSQRSGIIATESDPQHRLGDRYLA